MFCHTLTWISHGCTCVPHPEPRSHLPPHPISQGHPSGPALSTLSHALNLDWRSVSHMIICMFQCYSLKSSHPRLLPQSPKDCSLHLCLFCCLAIFCFTFTFLCKKMKCFQGEKWTLLSSIPSVGRLLTVTICRRDKMPWKKMSIWMIYIFNRGSETWHKVNSYSS